MDYADNLRIGDIVFRSGDRTVSKIIGSNMTHCGIYMGNKIIHDLYSNGLRYVTTDEYLFEATEPKEIQIIRLSGELSEVVIDRLLKNIMKQEYYLPYNKKPWNMCSSADSYNTASCAEYCYKQFIYAIWCLIRDEKVKASLKDMIKDCYGMQCDENIENMKLLEPIAVKIPDNLFAISESFFNKGNFNKGVFENRWEENVLKTHVVNSITIDSYKNSKYFTQIKK